MSKIFYNVDQTARRLGISEREVAALVRSGQLTTITVGNRKVIPAGVVDGWAKKNDGAVHRNTSANGTQATTEVAPEQTSDKHYYTDIEVAQRLGKPYTQILKMANLGQLPVTFVDGTRRFPKDAIDHLADQAMRAGGPVASAQKPLEFSSAKGNKYFRPDQLAHALLRSKADVERMIRLGEIEAVMVEGQQWIPQDEVEGLITRRQAPRQDRIRKRLPKPHSFPSSRDVGSTTVDGSASEASEPEDRNDRPVTNVSERALMKAAQELETSINKVRQMVANGNLVVHPGSGLLVAPEELNKIDKPPSTQQGKDSPSDVADSRSVEHPRGDPNGVNSTHAESEKIKALDEELEREKIWHARNLADAQHEIDQLDIQLENIRSTKDKTIEDLGADMEELELKAQELEAELTQERERREEAEHTVRSLRDEEYGPLWGSEGGDDEGSERHTPGSSNPVRGFLETFGKSVRDALGPEESTDRSGQWELAQLREELGREREAHENDRLKAQYDYAKLENVYRDLGEQNRVLKDEIDDIKSSLSGLPTREELEVKLNWNEARRRDLEESLTLEREKIRNLESGARKLAEIRRLLGGDSPPPPEHTETASSTTENNPDVSASDVLRVHTQHGEWVFRPPFALESDEVELIRLVAGEDEITAEQIKRRTGRRRAVKDLDYLLDRLHTEGLEPIKESSDRYSFDPDFLQD